MSRRADTKFVFLLEDEIRTAAKALQRLADLPAEDDRFGDYARDALNLCLAALCGADNDAAALVLTSAKVLGKLHKA